MSEFSPYSVTRGGFATPREMFLSIVQDLTRENSNQVKAFDIVYPKDTSELDYQNPDNPINDVIIVQASKHVDACAEDESNPQPWVVRFDTRSEIGHGMGHINVTTPLQIDMDKDKAPAIPYIPPNTSYDESNISNIQTRGTLGFIGNRVHDGNGAVPQSNRYGFINRAIYHTKIKEDHRKDPYGNLMWMLINKSSKSEEPTFGSRNKIPRGAFDDSNRILYRYRLEWYELMNPEGVNLNAVAPSFSTSTSPQPHISANGSRLDGFESPVYERRECTLYFRAPVGKDATNLDGDTFITTKVEGEVPPSLLNLAIEDSNRDELGLVQELELTFPLTNQPELVYHKISVERTGSPNSGGYRYKSSWIVDTERTNDVEIIAEAPQSLGDSSFDDENNKGLEFYDNLKWDLRPITDQSFDVTGEAMDPKEGARNVPMSYALTVSDHGIVLATWDQAVDQYETNDGHRFSWFATQRLVDKDTGTPLVDQSKSFCPLFCIYGVYHERVSTSNYFIVRESDVHRPSEEQTAGDDSPDSNAIINTYEQVAVSEDYEYVITVPSGLTTQRYLYLEEADLIGYTSADVISNGALSEFSMYDEGVCSIPNEAHVDRESCIQGNGVWEETSRLYKGLPATGKFNTGMRVLMRWYGGRLGNLNSKQQN
ncbi:hypothetical protein [Pseudoalteromonas peptidolytica]|uniref:Uncharacterized protein n=1 Tax=Pseudoalteromonas peptidolytica F12-50-A1 TaxID=1315280 RepID=A0A8I0MZK2_9GAMM|nr:hypothetical protein [Pseudoalteromonas peptidolytica]MBE0347864.1 hypothetical protein [Pseudoalteromonas peptidolytica F12-50-A1]MDW7551298.1 hypothetical protein [Pseudoalteromonas peptidolytica]NLR15336.1 hypothetical protein [Pseudoalteromonas peptidolytica]GEK07984.1 hypothetical protein PPE03_02330 [Pseudoalteromonas peptidolytica]